MVQWFRGLREGSAFFRGLRGFEARRRSGKDAASQPPNPGLHQRDSKPPSLPAFQRNLQAISTK